VDIDNFGQILSRIDPDTCLWIIVSKSFTTTETMANLAQVQAFLKRHHLNPEDHLVTITAKGSPGDDPANPVLASFHMFDFIGGRYSVTSAVGGVRV
jgi:glucose-6-phosphate isomerase